MKHKKQFFGVLISVLVCAFIVSLFVYATTTISEDIDVDAGKLVAGYDAIMEHALQVGNDSSVSYSRFGTTSTGHGLTANDDVLFGGVVEFDDDVYFDDFASIADDAYLRVPIIYGAVDSGRYLRIGDQALTSHQLDAQDDLLITGELEVDGTAFFDGVVSVSSDGLVLDGDITITSGIVSPSATCVVGSLYINTAGSVGEILYICDEVEVWTLITAE